MKAADNSLIRCSKCCLALKDSILYVIVLIWLRLKVKTAGNSLKCTPIVLPVISGQKFCFVFFCLCI